MTSATPRPRDRRQRVADLEARFMARVMRGSDRLLRVLGGRPVVVDGQTLAPDLQAMLRLARIARKPVVETLPLPQARAALLAQSVLVGGQHPVSEVRDLRVADLPARLYVPQGAPATGPLLLFLHGGGFFLGDLDSHDAPCRFLAERAGVRVLSVEYRLGPEARFPAAWEDAVAAFAWVREHAAEVGADLDRLGVGGDSAGGNLAAGVAHRAAREGIPLRAALLIYPTTDRSRPTRSSRLFDKNYFLTGAFMRRAEESYAASPDDARDPRYNPGRDDVPPDLAPTWVFTAGFDPLRDEGETYASRLAAAGVPVHLRRFSDQIHGFVNMLAAPSARAATGEIADAVRVALVD